VQSLRVVETPEFRSLLLLLRDEMDENAIPRRTKIRSVVMESLDDFFLKLKNDIQVCFSCHFMDDPQLFFALSELIRKSQFHG
jgi:hypothetical protein